MQTLLGHREFEARLGPGDGENVLMLLRDITEMRLQARQLKYMSLYDQLTGLHNRTSLRRELDGISKQRAYPVSIITANVDGLKLINDSMGQRGMGIAYCVKRYRCCVRLSGRARSSPVPGAMNSSAS